MTRDEETRTEKEKNSNDTVIKEERRGMRRKHERKQRDGKGNKELKEKRRRDKR